MSACRAWESCWSCHATHASRLKNVTSATLFHYRYWECYNPLFDGVAVGSIRLALFPHVFGPPVAPIPEQVRVSALLAFHQTRKSLQPNAYKNPIATPKGSISHTLYLTIHTPPLLRFSAPCFYEQRVHGSATLSIPIADSTTLIAPHHIHSHCLNPLAS